MVKGVLAEEAAALLKEFFAHLSDLHLEYNLIQDIGPLSGPAELTNPILSFNPISDFDPLVDNAALGSSAFIEYSNSGAPCSTEGMQDDIDTLMNRGVTVYFYCFW